MTKTNPAEGLLTIVPSDSTNLTRVTRGVWVGGEGTLKLTMVDGSVTTVSGIPAGTLLPLQAKRIWSTGTSATLILGLY